MLAGPRGSNHQEDSEILNIPWEQVTQFMLLPEHCHKCPLLRVTQIIWAYKPQIRPAQVGIVSRRL